MKPAEKALWLAISRNDMALIKLHWPMFQEPGQYYPDSKDYPSLSAINENAGGKSFFIHALESANSEVVDYLLKKLPLPVKLICDCNGKSPLSYAAAKGYSKVVAKLLEAKIPVDSVDKITGRTALSFGVEHGNETVVADLLLAKAKPNYVDAEGDRPLDYACQKGHTAIAAKLLEAGALPLPFYVDKDSKSALIHAIEKGDAELIVLLFSYAAAIGITLPEMNVTLCERLVELINSSPDTIFMLGTQNAEIFQKNSSAIFHYDNNKISIKHSSPQQSVALVEHCKYRLQQRLTINAQQDIERLAAELGIVSPNEPQELVIYQSGGSQEINTIADVIMQLDNLKAHILADQDDWLWGSRTICECCCECCCVEVSLAEWISRINSICFLIITLGLFAGFLVGAISADFGAEMGIIIAMLCTFALSIIAFIVTYNFNKFKSYIHTIDSMSAKSCDELVKYLREIETKLPQGDESLKTLQAIIASLTAPTIHRHQEVLGAADNAKHFFFSEQLRIQQDPEAQSGFRYSKTVAFYPPPKEDRKVPARGGNERSPLLLAHSINP